MGVVVGPLTHKLTSAAFDYEALSPFALKGKAERVHAWLARRPLGETGRRGPPAARPPPPWSVRNTNSPPASRIDASPAARGSWRPPLRHRGGRRRQVAPCGGAARQRRGEGLRLAGRGHVYPLLRPQHQLLALSGDHLAGRQAASRATTPKPSAGPELPSASPRCSAVKPTRFCPPLHPLLSLPVPEALVRGCGAWTGESMGRQVYRTAWLYFGRLARGGQAVLVVFEDVHWLDGSLAALIEHLLPLINETPLLFCCAPDRKPTALSRICRSSPTSGTPNTSPESCCHSLSSRIEAPARWRATWLHLDDLPPRFAERPCPRQGQARGDPFFVEEMMAA